MLKEDFYELGYIAKTHGTKGEVLGLIDADLPHHYKNLELVYLLQNGKPIPFFINKIKFSKPNQLFMLFEDVNHQEQAEELVGLQMVLPLKNLPPLPPGRFYYHELIGSQMIDRSSGPIGIIVSVLELPQQFVAAVIYQDHEVLVPLHDDFELNFDKTNQSLTINLPLGLLDVYTSKSDTESDNEGEQI